MFRALALRQSEDVVFVRSDERLTLETSAFFTVTSLNSLQWPIYMFNLVDISNQITKWIEGFVLLTLIHCIAIYLVDSVSILAFEQLWPEMFRLFYGVSRRRANMV